MEPEFEYGALLVFVFCHTASLSVLIRETEPRGCVCVCVCVERETEIYFKELAHMIKETDKAQHL